MRDPVWDSFYLRRGRTYQYLWISKHRSDRQVSARCCGPKVHYGGADGRSAAVAVHNRLGDGGRLFRRLVGDGVAVSTKNAEIPFVGQDLQYADVVELFDRNGAHHIRW